MHEFASSGLLKSARSTKPENTSACAGNLYRTNRTWRLAVDIAVIGIVTMTSAAVFKSKLQLLASWADELSAASLWTPPSPSAVVIKPNPTPAAALVTVASDSPATQPSAEKETQKLIATPETKAKRPVSPVEAEPALVERERITAPLKKSEWRLAPVEGNPPPIERDSIMLKRPGKY